MFGILILATLASGPVQAMPAPIITITELTPESVRVSVPEYPEETVNCGLTFTVGGATPGGAVSPQTSNTLSVDFSLDLCTNVYTFNASVTIGSESSGSTTDVFDSDLTTLDPVTNVRSEDDFVTLDWDAPVNAPANCTTNYEITVDGFSTFTTTTGSNSTSIPLNRLNLDTCEEYFITVAPITVRIGVVETSRSEPFRLLPAEGFPTPRISGIDFVYTSQGIVVNITWENDLLPQFSNALVLFDCGSEDVCTPANLSDSSSSHSLTLSYSVLGLDIEFSVTFLNPFCQRRASITTSFSSILESVDISDVTHNTAEVVVVYNSSISTLEGYTVRATIYPLNSTSPVQLFTQEIPVSAFEDQLTLSFTNLEAATDYVFDARILSTCIVIGRAESGTFTTESEPLSADSGGLSTGAAIGITFSTTFFGTFVFGMLFGAAIVYIGVVKREMKSMPEQPSTAQNVQGGAPVYEEPELIARERKIDTATNVAYGHTRF